MYALEVLMNHDALEQEITSQLKSLKIVKSDIELTAHLANERLAIVRNQIASLQNRLNALKQGQLELDIRPPMALA